MTTEQLILVALCACLTLAFLVRGSPIDLVAVVGLLVAAELGLIPQDKVFSGFSSPAVVTMAAVFFIGAAVRSSGANQACGNLIYYLSNGGPRLALFFLVIASGFISAFMNNVAAVALMLPVTMALAQRLAVPASQLLLPMSFGAVLGGMGTIMGTPPNLIAADIYAQHGYNPLDSSDFILSGGITLVLGAIMIFILAPKLLPRNNDNKPPVSNPELEKLYELLTHAYAIRIPEGSPLVGRTLEQIGASAALDAQVVAVMRESETVIAPMPDFRFKAGDLAVLGGEQDDLVILKNLVSFEALEGISTLNPSFSSFVGASVSLKADKAEWGLDHLSILSAENNIIPLFIRRGLNILAFASELLRVDDQIVVLGSKGSLDGLLQSQSMIVEYRDPEIDTLVNRSVFAIAISDAPAEQVLKACDLLKQRLGISLLAVQREEKLINVEKRALEPQKNDVLIFLGEFKKINQLRELLSVEAVETLPKLFLNTADVGVSEVVLSPRSKLVGKSLSELNFRERYGFRVLSVWREGNPIFQRLGHELLRFGDALLLLGPKQHLELLRDDPDFLVLTTSTTSKISPWKVGIVAFASLLLALLPMLGICSVPEAALLAACLVCVSGAVRVADAYRQVEWRVVIFTAALLPFSFAVEQTGFSTIISDSIQNTLGADVNPFVLIAAFGILSSLISQLLDGPVAVLLLTPIGISMAQNLGFHPETIVLMIAQAASITFLFPISHKCHLLVLGPGAYRNRDFLKIGIVISILSFISIFLIITSTHSLG
jgi:di/tricarboxylate transporter